MREIKFRGYNRKNNKWLYGYCLMKNMPKMRDIFIKNNI